MAKSDDKIVLFPENSKFHVGTPVTAYQRTFIHISMYNRIMVCFLNRIKYLHYIVYIDNILRK